MAQGDTYDKVEPTDLTSFGLIPEFVGRFPVVVSTTGLTLEQMVRCIAVR